MIARRSGAGAVAVAVMALLLLCAGCDGSAPIAHSGGPAPELAVLDGAGVPVTLADFTGKVVLVNFWITGCGPCLVEMPALDAAYRAWRDRGFALLAINMGQGPEALREVQRKLSLSFPLLADPLRITTSRYQVVGAPTSFLIDRDGRIRDRIDGPLTRADLEQRLAAMVVEGTSSERATGKVLTD